MNPHPEIVDGIDVDAVAAATRSCPAVDDLVEGVAGGVVSYLPGRRVAGVRVAADHVVVQVRSVWGVPVADLVGEIRASVTGLVAGRRLDIAVADIAAPPGWDEAWASTTDAPDGPSSARTTPIAAATPPSS